MDITLILLWILATLTITSLSGVLAKRYGVEYIISVVVALVVIANVIASKIVVVGSLFVPAAVIVYASTFLLTDIISEKWGKQQARKAVWAGFYANIILVVAVSIAVYWPSAPFASEFSESFSSVLGMIPRVVLASMIAYLVSQHHDIFAFHWWKNKTGGRHLWLRNIASTVVSQAIDTGMFITIAFYGVMDIVPLLIGQYVIKLIIAIIDTPFLYAISWFMDKIPSKD
ncbi:queuosine precursor transporter [Chloroflexota bacterium]